MTDQNPTHPGSADRVTVTVNLPAAVMEDLARFAATRGVTLSQAICDALQLQGYVAAVQDGGGRLLVKRETDHGPREVLF